MMHFYIILTDIMKKSKSLYGRGFMFLISVMCKTPSFLYDSNCVCG